MDIILAHTPPILVQTSNLKTYAAFLKAAHQATGNYSVTFLIWKKPGFRRCWNTGFFFF
jgi:hypothetical protein